MKFCFMEGRSYRVIREKKYLEESKIQSLVMMPLKETKHLTYQLLENNFIQLQELKKSVSANAMSKAFYLFYVDMNRVRE
jgi:DNA-directed RNA polymerase III subunit RPC3